MNPCFSSKDSPGEWPDSQASGKEIHYRLVDKSLVDERFVKLEDGSMISNLVPFLQSSNGELVKEYFNPKLNQF